jgi:mannose/fructose/N-acetylgalactosamine-specific phosphotransferase system component IIB
LAAQIDPLNINNMSQEAARKLIVRSVAVDESDMDTVFQLPATTWIGGSVRISIFQLFERTRRRKIAKQFSDGAGVSL